MNPYTPALLASIFLGAGLLAAGSVPRVFLLDGEVLIEARARARGGEEGLQAAFERLREDGERALTQGPWSVMDKTMLPPSGDRHDYMSVGPYWWPNPDTEDGLPYVNRDGQVNPEYRGEAYDATRMGRMVNAVRTLGHAWFFTGEERFAARAAEILRVWFVRPETRMNPNLHYAQAVPGRNDGRSTGIIESRALVDVVDAIGLLAGSESWSEEDQQALVAWFADYVEWLTTSPRATANLRARNNIGSFYDVQVACFALFVGDEETARETLAASAERRLMPQVEPDGSQPHELRRTNSFGYSSFNLMAFFQLAMLAERIGLDLWHVSSEDGRSIRQALDFLAAYLAPDAEWPYPQGGSNYTARLAPRLLQAARVYDDARYIELFESIDERHRSHHRFLLQWPPPAAE